jgi:hypothetical protein
MDVMVNRSPLVLIALLLASCGGGGSDDGSGAGVDQAQAPPAPPSPPAPETVTVSGAVTFDFVPAVAALGLDYASTQPKPARGVTIELLSGASVIASTATDSAGAYSFTVGSNVDVSLRVRAEMLRAGSPSWLFTVVDNTNGDALYVLDGTPFNTGIANTTRNLHAASGWSGVRYSGVRSAAPFAILDTVYDAVQLVLTAAPTLPFPPLELHWSTSNISSFGANGIPDFDTGEIGTSFFLRGAGIYLVGAEDSDTDEYDRHVIAHEWGHYLESEFSRSDSIGGPHTRHDQLDLRVAFGEGWGNAFSAMVTGQSVYRDSFGPGQSRTFAFDVEGPPSPAQANHNPGWYSEESIQEILYDLFDSHVDLIRNTLVADNVALGFAPLYEVLTGPQKTTMALTSVFPFIDALRAQRPADAALIDDVVAAQSITPIADAYASTEAHFGTPATADLQSVYSTLAVNDPTPARVCSLDDYSSLFTGSTNKLGSRRFVRFTATSAGPHTFTARAVAPLNAAADPDMVLHRGAALALSNGPPKDSCSTGAPQDCVETFTTTLSAGDYVLEVYEWTNTNATNDEYPPIGRTCFDVSVTQP